VMLENPHRPVYLHTKGVVPFAEDDIERLKQLGTGNLRYCDGPVAAHDDGVTLAVEGADNAAEADGIVGDNVLYILKPQKIDPKEILVFRKRMSTPLTSPVAEWRLRRAAGEDLPMVAGPSEASQKEFLAALQRLSNTPVDPAHNPVVFTAGLPAITAMYSSFVTLGGADVLMCSTAYGGSSQLTQIFHDLPGALKRHTFDIQGDTDVTQSITRKLAGMSESTDLLPTLVLFVEMPTNPDMKIPEIKPMLDALKAFRQRTGRQVMLAVDTTFAPGSGVLGRVAEVDPEFPAMVFISMSKSLSRGLTTAGCIIANHTQASTRVLEEVRAVSTVLDTQAKPDQLRILCENHHGVIERCQSAYNNARAVGTGLVAAVKDLSGETMGLQFVLPEHADLGYTTSSFSFNLPAPKGATQERKAALAQDFVTAITQHRAFKPCVSFGQDNGLVYATVPATSTQGAISNTDKDKQAADGVQLVRLSFPVQCDCAAVLGHMTAALKGLYGGLDQSSVHTTNKTIFAPYRAFPPTQGAWHSKPVPLVDVSDEGSLSSDESSLSSVA